MSCESSTIMLIVSMIVLSIFKCLALRWLIKTIDGFSIEIKLVSVVVDFFGDLKLSIFILFVANLHNEDY